MINEPLPRGLVQILLQFRRSWTKTAVFRAGFRKYPERRFSRAFSGLMIFERAYPVF